jgi:tetratricopeptide (TPR) repeat protein
MRPALPVACGLLLTLSLPAPARADSWAQAGKLLRQATKVCAGKEPEKALPLYEQALEAKVLPQIHLAYGECLQKVGKCAKAVEQFEKFLKMVRSRHNRDQGKMLIKACKDQLDEEAARQPPRPTTVPAEQAPTVEQPPDLRALTASRPAPRPKPPRRRLSPVYFWTGVGVTAALLVVGTATGVVALQKSDRFNDLKTPYGELKGLQDTGQTLTLTSTITFAVGGAAAVATTVLFFYTRFKRAETVSAAPVPGGTVVVLGGRF